MNNIDKEFLKAISRQVTDNVPKLYIQDINSGRVFEYGANCHHRLVISEDCRTLSFYNLQNGDGSSVGDYRFYYEKPEDETDFDADEWARMVKHQSISQLLAEERKKVVQEIRDLAGDYFEMPYCDACGNTDFNDVVLTGNDLTEILDDVERGD